MARANPLPFDQPPANLDTPDDQDEGRTGNNANPQGGGTGSSFFIPDPAGTSSSSSSSEEGVDYSSVVVGGSVPTGTAQPGSGPVVGAGQAAGGSPQGGGQTGRGQQGTGTGGNQGVSDQNSGEAKSGGGMLVAGKISQIQAEPKSNKHHSSAGTSAGIAIGVLLLVSVATVAIIFAIRKRRDGFMRFYSQANNEL
ncbi:oleosin-B3-like [Patiria miniata]|uniref:Uncharacterized protein n=1 Tax=Patiria miniata TaxID=46514 RepID=A0A914B876_PATMI|nr:oleosin-B3-like [Patiria miniata]